MRKLSLHEIADVAFYNEDEEVNAPAPWTALRYRVKKADAPFATSLGKFLGAFEPWINKNTKAPLA